MKFVSKYYKLMKHIYLYILCIFFAVSISLYSYDLGTIYVSADSIESNFEKKIDVSYNFDIIENREIRTTLTGVVDLINQLPGIRTTRYGTADNFSALSVRGSGINQNKILFDGISLHSLTGLTDNINDFPLAIIDNIQVYKSFSPPSVNVQAIGGIINLNSRIPEDNYFSISKSIGSFSTEKYFVSVSQNFNKIGYFLNYSYSFSKGNFKFTDDRATPYNPDDDIVTRRQNNDYLKRNILSKLEYKFDKRNRFDFLGIYSDNYNGIAGYGSNQNKNSYYESENYLFKFGYERNITKTSMINFNYIISNNNYHYFNTEPFGLGRFDTDDNHKTYIYDINYNIIFGNHISNFILTVTNEDYKPFNRLESFSNQISGKMNSLKIKYSHETFFENNLRINPSIIYETNNLKTLVYDKDIDELSTQIGLYYNTGRNFFIKTSYAKYFRMPFMYELFGNEGYLIGNSNLRPEKSYNFDLTLLYLFNANRFSFNSELSFFHKNTDDLIRWIINAQGIGRPVNFSRVVNKGIEFSYSLNFNNGFYYKSAYTFIESLNKDIRFKNNNLPNQPEYDIFKEIGFENKKISCYVNINKSGEFFQDDANRRRVPSKHYINTGLTYMFYSFDLSFEINNINNETHNDVYGYPLPGRNYLLRLKFEY